LARGDGITGDHCLEMTIPTGGVSVGGWWRPFSRIAAGKNGLPYDDLGAGGTVPLRSDWYYTAGVNDSTPASKWQGGIYSHPDYWGHSNLNPALGSNMFDGSDFYLQFRVKIQSTRWTSGNPDGKLCFVSSMRKSNPSQEIVIQSQNVWPYDSAATTNIYRMYTSNGNQFNSFLTDPQGGSGTMQPNGPYASTCVIAGPLPQRCWTWPSQEWVTVLIHVTPGHQSTNGSLSDPAAADTGLEVWVARQGATTYTKIWQKMNYIFEFGGAQTAAYPDDSAEGFSAFIASGFMNDSPAVAGWYQRFDQIILSKQFIPCPLV
jgi:hypothetical protein